MPQSNNAGGIWTACFNPPPPCCAVIPNVAFYLLSLQHSWISHLMESIWHTHVDLVETLRGKVRHEHVNARSTLYVTLWYVSSAHKCSKKCCRAWSSRACTSRARCLRKLSDAFYSPPLRLWRNSSSHVAQKHWSFCEMENGWSILANGSTLTSNTAAEQSYWQSL